MNSFSLEMPRRVEVVLSGTRVAGSCFAGWGMRGRGSDYPFSVCGLHAHINWVAGRVQPCFQTLLSLEENVPREHPISQEDPDTKLTGSPPASGYEFK